jgi:hypothetical protein
MLLVMFALPTRASILTGKYPATMNLTEWLNGRSDRPYQVLLNPHKAMALDPKETTLAEVLKKEGLCHLLFLVSGTWVGTPVLPDMALTFMFRTP